MLGSAYGRSNTRSAVRAYGWRRQKRKEVVVAMI